MIERILSTISQSKPGPFGISLVGVLTLSCLLSLGFILNTGGTVETIAGTGIRGFSGDGGPATQAQLNGPAGLALASNGTLYFADTFNNRVRRIDPSGAITTVAGTGQPLFNGDNISATAANLAAPHGIALDPSGNILYIADTSNHVVRKMDLTTGFITTVAGKPLEPGFGGDGGLAVKANLNNPGDVAIDSTGALLVADMSNFRIRRIDLSTGIITTIAGIGRKGFSGDDGPASLAEFTNPVSITTGPNGDLFVADGNRVRRIASDGTITTVAGTGGFVISSADQLGDGGPATSAILRFASDVAFDNAGNMYIAELSSNRIRRVDTNGQISTVVGSGDPRLGGFRDGPTDQAQLNRPSGVLVDDGGNIIISDSSNFRLRKVIVE